MVSDRDIVSCRIDFEGFDDPCDQIAFRILNGQEQVGFGGSLLDQFPDAGGIIQGLRLVGYRYINREGGIGLGEFGFGDHEIQRIDFGGGLGVVLNVQLDEVDAGGDGVDGEGEFCGSDAADDGAFRISKEDLACGGAFFGGECAA